ncbi:MAG TPA: 50S ribosomal protein L11 methyltransferase [Verrucomicrobiae bacterium]|jgi:ribosomal protein L11 methyltransferase
MKSRKPLWKISVVTTPEAEDAVMELFGRIFGGNASSYFDLEKKVSLVSLYHSGKLLADRLRSEIRTGLNEIRSYGISIGSGRISISKVRREDWAESWKRHFQPLEIGKTLLVKPSWSRKRRRPGQAEVILDPGLSFGTGQHPTTLFCLRCIARYKGSGDAPALFDIGTGSGILAIAAAKLGFSPVHAIDFDPDAVRIARANAQKNRVKLRIARGDVCRLKTNPKRRFDVVCANLISNLLIAEREKIVAQLNPGGWLLLAGILKTEFADVQRVYARQGLKLILVKTEKEWRSGLFKLEHLKKN